MQTGVPGWLGAGEHCPRAPPTRFTGKTREPRREAPPPAEARRTAREGGCVRPSFVYLFI